MKSTPPSLFGRRLRRQSLALVLVLTTFLPTLVVTVSAHTPADTSPEGEHFVIYRGANGDTVCREATEAEARELDQIRPTNLKQINHLDDEVLKSRGLTTEDLPQHLKIILRATDNLKANSAAEAAFNRAAAAWESVITSPVTIYIDARGRSFRNCATPGPRMMSSQDRPSTPGAPLFFNTRHHASVSTSSR